MSLPPVIPDSFRRFDTRVSSDDQFLNSRDLLYARQNFNILLARRARWPLFSTTFTGSVSEFIYDVAILGQLGAQLNILHWQPVHIPYYAPTVQIAVYGAVNAASGSAWLYPMIFTSGEIETQYSNGAQHTAGTTVTKTQLQVDVPASAREFAAVNGDGSIPALIGVAAEMHLDGTSLGDNETVVSSGIDWVVTSRATPQYAAGDFIFVTGKISQTLRRVFSAVAVSDGSLYRISPAWSYTPQKDETINGQSLVAYIPDTITAWADRATDAS